MTAALAVGAAVPFNPGDVHAANHPSAGADVPPPEMPLLGSRLLLATYASAFEWCGRWARADRPVAVEFANTQVLTMRRREAPFRELSRAFDRVIPDATPLIWCLNARGAGLADRVYGPKFMDYALRHSPATLTHYFIGGSEACGQELRRRYAALNPQLKVAGSFHGRCDAQGRFAEGEEALLAELREREPDFIWVGLGTPKQQAWIQRQKPQLRRGVLLSIGQAFDVNAGMRADAPMWMQRLGLTWLFRMGAEPRRLIPRYVKYNSLFLFYLLWDGVRGKLYTAYGADGVEK